MTTKDKIKTVKLNLCRTTFSNKLPTDRIGFLGRNRKSTLGVMSSPSLEVCKHNSHAPGPMASEHVWTVAWDVLLTLPNLAPCGVWGFTMKELHGRSLCSKGKSEDSTLLLGLLMFYNLGHWQKSGVISRAFFLWCRENISSPWCSLIIDEKYLVQGPSGSGRQRGRKNTWETEWLRPKPLVCPRTPCSCGGGFSSQPAPTVRVVPDMERHSGAEARKTTMSMGPWLLPCF